mgnify:CR=1 FL=1
MPQRHADQQRLQRAGDLALRPDDVGAELRPLEGGVVAESEQIDLRLVFEEEIARESEQQTEDEHARQGGRPSVSHVSRFF